MSLLRVLALSILLAAAATVTAWYAWAWIANIVAMRRPTQASPPQEEEADPREAA